MEYNRRLRPQSSLMLLGRSVNYTELRTGGQVPPTLPLQVHLRYIGHPWNHGF